VHRSCFQGNLICNNIVRGYLNSCAIGLLTVKYRSETCHRSSHNKMYYNPQVGDQLLEVCGINMRSATYQLAANVLRQCGNSITMLVQYSPDSK
jgi:hypothetical protein